MNRLLKATILVFILVAVTAAFGLAGQTARPDGKASGAAIKASLDKAPVAVFPQMKFEFDPIFEGTEIKHNFVVENKGEAPLVIKNIRPD